MLDSPLYTWIALPVLIFCARIVDVSFGTFRIICISRGMKFFAAVVGFFEILVWLLAMGQIFRHLNNIACYIAYSAGFATGSFLGVYIAEKWASGKVIVRIITAREPSLLIEKLKTASYGVTRVKGEGAEGPVSILFSVVCRKNLSHLQEMIKQFSPRAFFTIEDIRCAKEGIFPAGSSVLSRSFMEMFKPQKKAK